MPEIAAERTFPANPETVPEVLDFVSGVAESAGVHPRRVLHLQLAVEEAMMNISSYAYETPPGEVLVRIECVAGRFITEMIDEGVPFDPMEVEIPDLTADARDRAIGGLGIYLYRRVMDEVHYRREGGRNILTLVINLEE